MIDQIKKIKNLGFALLAILAISFTSCDTDSAELIDVEDFTDSSIESIQSRSIGKNYCLEFIFPISVQFIDETSSEASGYEELHEIVKAWFEANDVEKTRENKPQLTFPIQVMNMDGEVIDVASLEELKDLKTECPKSGKCKGKRGKGFKCFSLVFPVTLTIGDTEATFEDQSSLKTAVRAYKLETDEDAERPTFVFPITIEYDDETQVEVSSQEELQSLKEACQDEEG